MATSPVISESVSRTARKRARNRAALIASARRLFGQVGFEATTIAAIAESADLGFGTFYLYFRDKDAILDAVLEIGRLELDKALTHPDNERAEPAEALRRLTMRFARAAERNYDVMALGFRMAVGGEGVGEPIRPDLNKGAVPIFFFSASASAALLSAVSRRACSHVLTRGSYRVSSPVRTFLSLLHTRSAKDGR